MSDESQLQVRAKEADSSLSLLKVRSGLIARGRRDVGTLTAPFRAEFQEHRYVAFMANVADIFDDSDRPTEEILKNATEGDAKQQNILAVGYWLGLLGLEKDLSEAITWFGKAAAQDHAPSQFCLGWMFDHVGVPVTHHQGVPVTDGTLARSKSEAAKWYRKAADQGYAPAQFNLGVMYDNGEGVVQDYAEAVAWYRKAADQGILESQVNLGLKYNTGRGVDQNYTEALRWFRSAAEAGRDTAQFSLGLNYANGQGVEQDYIQAHMWMNLAVAYRFSCGSGIDDEEGCAAMRDSVAARMTPAQILEAERLAREWKPKS